MQKITFLIFSLFFFFSSAQEITVRSGSTNEPIPGVAVFNNEKSVSTVTDLDGKVTLDLFDLYEKITFQHLSYNKIEILKSNIGDIVLLKMKSQNLEEVVISASKFEQNRKEVPQTIVSFKSQDIVFSNPQTSADLLTNTGQVYIQKSQLGGGSPMIRGFSTNRLLLTIDGVRMNNAIFRGGNVQNILSIDPFSVQNTEIILGAGSVIYGSDAIGGVMNFYTKKPQLAIEESLLLKVNSLARYSTASNEKTGHLDINFGKKKWAFLTSVSYTDFDDLKMGENGPEDYLRPEFVETSNGNDQVVINNDPRIQKSTGYDQLNFLQKIHYRTNNRLSFDLGIHYSTTSDYPRYDRLIRYEDDQLHSAEWYYGPQKWFLSNFQMTKMSSQSNLYDKIKITAAYQNFQESRYDRNLFSETKRIRKENVDAISLNFDFEKSISDYSKVSYGGEYIYNSVNSKGHEQNIMDRSLTSTTTRYPNGSSWQSIATYTNYKYKPNKKFTFQTGIRYNFITIKADLGGNNEFFILPFEDVDINNGAFSGTAGISWTPSNRVQWKLNATSAFRAPNIDDIGKVFDSEPGSVVVPNADLKSEFAYGGEIGLKLNFDEKVVIDLASYYTYLDNALVRRDYSINGQTEIIYDGELSNVQAIQNASKAWIYGFEAGLKINFSEEFKLTSQYSTIGGTEEDSEGIEVPVRHVAPSFGNTHLIWDRKKMKLDIFLSYNAALENNKISPSIAEYLFARDRNGNPYAPSWYTLNVRSQYQINEELCFTAALENITNQRYKPYSSGIAGPGTNLILALKYSL